MEYRKGRSIAFCTALRCRCLLRNTQLKIPIVARGIKSSDPPLSPSPLSMAPLPRRWKLDHEEFHQLSLFLFLSLRLSLSLVLGKVARTTKGAFLLFPLSPLSPVPFSGARRTRFVSSSRIFQPRKNEGQVSVVKSRQSSGRRRSTGHIPLLVSVTGGQLCGRPRAGQDVYRILLHGTSRAPFAVAGALPVRFRRYKRTTVFAHKYARARACRGAAESSSLCLPLLLQSLPAAEQGVTRRGNGRRKRRRTPRRDERGEGWWKESGSRGGEGEEDKTGEAERVGRASGDSETRPKILFLA